MSITVKVKPAHASQGDFVVIDIAQFDPLIHELADGESLPDELNDSPIGNMVPIEQFDALAEKLAFAEEQLATAKEDSIAFQNDIPAMEARVAELKSAIQPETPTAIQPDTQNAKRTKAT